MVLVDLAGAAVADSRRRLLDDAPRAALEYTRHPEDDQSTVEHVGRPRIKKKEEAKNKNIKKTNSERIF